MTSHQQTAWSAPPCIWGSEGGGSSLAPGPWCLGWTTACSSALNSTGSYPYRVRRRRQMCNWCLAAAIPAACSGRLAKSTFEAAAGQGETGSTFTVGPALSPGTRGDWWALRVTWAHSWWCSSSDETRVCHGGGLLPGAILFGFEKLEGWLTKSEFRFVQVFSFSGCSWRTLSIVSGLRHVKFHVNPRKTWI